MATFRKLPFGWLPLAGLLFQLLGHICSAQSLTLTNRGTWPGFPGGSAVAASVISNVAYVVAGESLQVFDVQNPTQPVRLSGLPLNYSFAEDIDVLNDYAYVVDESGDLLVFKVTNQTNPAPISATFVGDPYAIQVAGNFCYISVYDYLFGGVLRIYDISNPVSPSFVADAYVPGRAHVVGEYVYNASGSYGLIVSNIHDPSTPTYVGGIATVGSANDVYVVGNIAYVATSSQFPSFSGGLEIFDVSNPAVPVALGEFFGPWGERVQVAGTTAYLTSSSIGDNLFAIDVSDPAQPVFVSAIVTPTSYPYDIQAIGDIVYLAGDGLEIFDVSNPAEMQQIGTAKTRWYSLAVEISGNYAYLANEEAGLEILCVSDPDHPARVGHYDTDIAALDVRVAGNYAYVAAELYLDVVDIQDPSQPVRVGRYVPSAYVRALDIAGSHLYLPEGPDGLRVLDISNPTNPLPVGLYDTSGIAVGVKVVGNLAYVADNADGLQVIDVSNPASPVRLGGFNTDGSAVAVDISSNYAFVADGPNALVVIDVSNPTTPTYVNELPVYAYANDVQVVGSLAYLADSGWVKAIDVSNPTNLTVLAEQSVNGDTSGLRVAGDKVYVADGYWGLDIFQINVPLVLNTPLLSGGMINLSWNGGPGIKLQRTTSLSNPDWQDVPNSEGVSNLTLPAGGTSSFFRLRK